MKKNIIKKISMLGLAALFALSSCTKNFDDINTDPDAYTGVPTTNQLGEVLTRSARQFGDNFEGVSIWAGYIVCQEYIDTYGDLLPSNNTYGNKWYQCYYGSTQLNDIIGRTNDTETKNMRNVARVWKSYLLLLCTDSFGQIPYTDAFKGAPEDGGILQTPYDEQSVVYPALLDTLKVAADNWAAGIGSDEIGDGDFIYGGDASMWQRFCNSLRLRVAMRLSGKEGKGGVYSGSQALAEEILNNPSKYPVIETNDQKAYFWWQGSGDYYERWYNAHRSRPNDYCISQIFIDHMNASADPRLPVMARANSDGEYIGGEQGYNAQSLPNESIYAKPGDNYGYNAAGFTPYYRACETYFAMAEAALNGWNVPMSAEEAYTKAVELSMEENDEIAGGGAISDSDVEAYLAGAGAWDGTYGRLYMEEWVSLFKESHEAWSLYRRTGYPTYIQTARSSTGGDQYPGDKSVWGDAHTDVPFRMPYPANQFTYNADNVNAASANVVDYCWGEQMWWDTRTGVK